MTTPSIDPSSAILLFDSGVGGLSVLAELRALAPAAPVIYAADNAALPYGDKSEAQIAARVAGLLGRMTERFKPRLACIACNTASTIALGMVREVLEIPIVGTVPAIKPAAAITESGVIGLLGTRATIQQTYVDQLESRFAADKKLLRLAAPELVNAAEAKLRAQPVDKAAIASAADRLRGMPGGDLMDTVVLACTHFPLVQEELQEAFGPDIRFVHGAQGIARRIIALNGDQPFVRDRPDFALVTRPDEAANALAASLGRYGILSVEEF